MYIGQAISSLVRLELLYKRMSNCDVCQLKNFSNDFVQVCAFLDCLPVGLHCIPAHNDEDLVLNLEARPPHARRMCSCGGIETPAQLAKQGHHLVELRRA